jgi:hypothetical protein
MVIIYKCDNCKEEVLAERFLYELRAGNHYFGQYCDRCLINLKLTFKKGDKNGQEES